MSRKKKSFRAKAIEEAKRITRLKGSCEKCGVSALKAQMHGSHIMPVTYAATAADLENILCLCAGCHNMRNDSWHHDIIGNARWFEQKWPGRYDKLQAKAISYSQNPFPKINWEEIYLTLKS